MAKAKALPCTTEKEYPPPRLNLQGGFAIDGVDVSDKITISAQAELVETSIKDYDGNKRTRQEFILTDIKKTGSDKGTKDNDLKAKIMRGGSGGVSR